MKNQLSFYRIPQKSLLQWLIVICSFLSINSLFSQEIIVNKYAVENAANCNQFDITLEVIGNPPIQPQEVILVIDRSGSMIFDDGDPTTPLPIEAAQDAALEFINQFFLPANNPTGLNKIGIVTFGTTASLDQPLTDSSGQAALITTINTIVPVGRTNTEQAVIFADNELTDNGTFDCKTSRSIILLSDGVPTSRDPQSFITNCNSVTTVTPCQTEAIQSAQDSWTTTVNGEVFNQNFFTIGLIGGVDGITQDIGVNTLDQMQNSGAFTTEVNADLTGIYNTILGQLVAAAMQLPNQALVTDVVETGYSVVPGSIVASKGSGSVSGQTVSWDVNSVSNETITLNYTIEGTPTVCGVNPSGTSTINYQDSSCNTASLPFDNPTVCLPCPDIEPTITQSACASIDYSSTLDQGGCSSVADSYAWEFFLNGNSVGTSNTLNGTFNYTGTPAFEGDFTATLTYTGTYGTGCILPNVSENSNTITLPNTLGGNISAQTNVICSGTATGEIVVEGTNGTAPYSYSIDGGNNFEQSGTFSDLASGSYTITILDDLGCTATVSANVLDEGDSEDPTITCPANITATTSDDGTGNCSTTATLGTPTTSDNCSIASVVAQVDGTDIDPVTFEFPIGETTVTWVVTDAAGNTADCSQTITVTDNEDPTITCPETINISVDAGVDGAIANYTTPVGIDNCPGATTTQTAGLPSGSQFPIGTTTNTFEVTDAAGNTVTCSFDVTVTDNEDPTITCPETININVDAGADGAVVNYTAPVGSDNAPGATTTQIAGLPSGSLFPIGTTTNTFEVTDAAGNTVTCSFDVTVTDNEDPTISCIDPINLNVDSGVCGAIVTYTTPVGTDNAPGATTTQTAGLPSGSLFPIGTTTNTFEVTDAAGNSVTCSFDVVVIDDEDPTITCPADIIANTSDDATGNCLTTVALGTPETNDNCTVASVIAQVNGTDIDPVTFEFPLGDTTVTWIVTDNSGNTASCEQSVTVNDDEAPTITCPADITVTADPGLCSASNVDLGEATANDNCEVATILNNALEPFALGETIVIWTVTDASGNATTCEQIVTVLDGELPEITCPPAVTVNVDPGTCEASNVSLGDINAADCTDVIITNNAPVTFPLGDTTVIWTVTDLAGNAVTCEQLVTVIDNIPPTFVETLPTDTTVECDAVPNAETLTATDNCSEAVVTFNEVRIDGSCVSNYIIERTWTATDDNNLTTVHTQTITVQDTTPPVFVGRLPVDITVECDAIPTAEVVEATDNCSTATVESEDNIIEGVCVGTYTIERIYTATDECGLTVSYTQTINVQDTTAPTPAETLEENITVSCTDIPEVPEIQFVDNCSTDVVIVFDEVNGFDDTVFEDYQIIRTWTVRDTCDNEAVYTQTLNVMLDEIITEVNGPDRCYNDGIIDLNEFLSSENQEGTWELIEGNTEAELDNNLFNPTTLTLSEDFKPGSESIDYTFRYTGLEDGCINITEVTMAINADCIVLPCGDSDVEISKALTPNGDGFNDSFDIMGIDLCGFTANVKIFNRWGALIFESSNYTLGEGQGTWQGNAHKSSVGSAGRVPNGTYYYIINLENSGLAPFTGPIYIGTK